MVKDTTIVTTYKFKSLAPTSKNLEKVVRLKIPVTIKSSKDTKKSLEVKQYRVTDVFDKTNLS